MLADAAAFAASIDALAEPYLGAIDVVAGIEARGFVFAAPVAHRLGVGFVPVRKPGKLPWRTTRREYDLEYGSDALEVHTDAVRPGQRVLLVDDVLATGGTAEAATALFCALDAPVVAASFLIELPSLGGRRRLDGVDVHAVVTYD